MLQRIRPYTPDSDSGGSGKSKGDSSSGTTPANPGGELGGAGGSDGSGTSVSGPANLNDDDLGVAGLGVANLESSATGNSGPIDPIPLPAFDEEEAITEGDDDTAIQ